MSSKRGVETQSETDTVWLLQWAEPGEGDWVRHAKTTGDEAAKAALTEFRSHPKSSHLSWRALRVETTVSVEDW